MTGKYRSEAGDHQPAPANLFPAAAVEAFHSGVSGDAVLRATRHRRQRSPRCLAITRGLGASQDFGAASADCVVDYSDQSQSNAGCWGRPF